MEGISHLSYHNDAGATAFWGALITILTSLLCSLFSNYEQAFNTIVLEGPYFKSRS